MRKPGPGRIGSAPAPAAWARPALARPSPAGSARKSLDPRDRRVTRENVCQGYVLAGYPAISRTAASPSAARTRSATGPVHRPGSAPEALLLPAPPRRRGAQPADEHAAVRCGAVLPGTGHAGDGTADTAAGDRARSRPNRADDRPSVNTHSTPPVPPCRSPVSRPPSPARKVRHPDVKVIYVTVST